MMLLSQRREVGEFKKRYKWMALAVLAAFAMIFVRIVQLQLVQHERWAAEARENITKTIPLPAVRGTILDTHGRVIATNRPSYDVYVTPQLIRADRDLDRIAELLGLDAAARAAFEAKLAAIPLHRRTHQIEMFRDVSRDQLAAIETHGAELPAVDVVAAPLRTYPYGHLGAHAIGYLNEVSAEDLERLASQDFYRSGDRIGRAGLERSLETILRGRRGFRRVLVDARGSVQHRPPVEIDAQPESRAPVPGRDVVLTLDMELMRTIERAFRGHPSGSVVVVDVRTGSVRALFSKPAYDLNEMTARLDSERYREMLDDPFRPLIDKTVYESYFPGSTFKPLSAIAALEDHLVDPTQRIECIGYYQIGNQRMRCTSAHGDVDMRDAIVESCNVYFWKLAEQVGLERLNRVARDFGLGERTGIGINSEARGFLASRAWYEEHYERFRVGYTLNTAIGQGNTRSTLIQLGLAYAALANGGTLFVPQLVERIQAPNGQPLEQPDAQIRRQVRASPESLSLIRDGMVGVVRDQTGTAHESRIEGGISVAGKTGTAEVAPGSSRMRRNDRRAWYFQRAHAWFAGFAPAEEPEIAIVVLVEHGGGGGRTAAPIAMQILQEYLGERAVTASNDSTGAPFLEGAF